MTLRARAEAAAKEIGQCNFGPSCYDNRDEIADAIEAVAREHAERALRSAFTVERPYTDRSDFCVKVPGTSYIGYQRGVRPFLSVQRERESQDMTAIIDQALRAAEVGEP